MEVAKRPSAEKKERDARQDYPESDPEIQIVCVIDSTLG
jgi:predicted dienelactone hydrolase